MNKLNKIANIIDQATQELREDNDRADRAAALARMVEQVNRDAASLQKIHKKVFPHGCAISVEQEKALMAGCFPIVSVKE